VRAVHLGRVGAWSLVPSRGPGPEWSVGQSPSLSAVASFLYEGVRLVVEQVARVLASMYHFSDRHAESEPARASRVNGNIIYIDCGVGRSKEGLSVH
jgi:hypothetical protein